MNVPRITAPEAAAELASYRALELGTPQGRVLAKCEVGAHPVWLRELDDVRGCPWCRVAEMEKASDTSPPPATVLVKLALALREQPAGRQVLGGLDELGEIVVCDGDPADIVSMVAALQYLIGCDTPAPDAPAPPLVIYRAEHGDIVAGDYTTAQAAQQLCEALVSREYPDTVSVLFEWAVDRADPAGLELDVSVDGTHLSTGYTVTPRAIPTAYDPDADE